MKNKLWLLITFLMFAVALGAVSCKSSPGYKTPPEYHSYSGANATDDDSSPRGDEGTTDDDDNSGISSSHNSKHASSK